MNYFRISIYLTFKNFIRSFLNLKVSENKLEKLITKNSIILKIVKLLKKFLQINPKMLKVGLTNNENGTFLKNISKFDIKKAVDEIVMI